MESELIDKIFSVSSSGFEPLALEVFRFQYENNALYRRYADALHVEKEAVTAIRHIPFLPIRFFKSHIVASTDFIPQLVFESSGTTGSINSRHHVKDAGIYHKSFVTTFERFYGPAQNWCILGLLPSYLERQGSSLTLMAEDLISRSRHPQSGFYLYDHEALYNLLQQLEQQQQPTLLLGVTFGLLDFAEQYSMQLRHTIVMETGGMKGRREEMTRQQLHAILKERLGIAAVHSEYGMTELLSQAYSKGEGIYHCPPWMKVLIREEEDPLAIRDESQASIHHPLSGVVNIIDLANIHSCAFIATDDTGRLYPNGSFEVLGRIDNSDIRGCSLMIV